MWRGPDYPGEVPTLGWSVLDWLTEYLVVPDGPLAGEPLILTPEQAQFVLDFYAIDHTTGKRSVRRGVLSRPKGWGKSPLVAALCIAEAVAPVVPNGWDADGDPVGVEWRELGFKPKVQILGVSEDQTANTWDPLLDMIREGPLVNEPGVEAMESFVNVPRGRIEAATSSSTSREGFRPIFAVFDQTESWIASNGGKKLAATVRRNLTKTGGSSVETPNSFRPGFDSVAEDSHKAWTLQQEGKLKNRTGILFDHREAPADTDITERDSMLVGLRRAYGCSANAPCYLAERGDHAPHEPGWVELPRILADFWDPSTDPSDGRMYFLNQITSASDSWLTQPEWMSCLIEGPAPVVRRDEPITLGFDGSRSRARGKADATALVACRVSDGYVWPLRVWEQPDDWRAPTSEPGARWEVPVSEVEAEVVQAFAAFSVVGFYADPAKWESYVANWEARYGKRLKVGTPSHPIAWWMTGGRSYLVAKAISSVETAVREGELKHSGSAVLTRHVLNSRRRIRGQTVQIGKEHPDSDRKVDAAVAMVLAWQARNDALAKGIGNRAAYAPRRIR